MKLKYWKPVVFVKGNQRRKSCKPVREHNYARKNEAFWVIVMHCNLEGSTRVPTAEGKQGIGYSFLADLNGV